MHLASICERHNIVIISDEVYADLVIDTKIFTSILALDINKLKVVLCTSPNKAFNIAGASLGIGIVPNEAMREKILYILQDVNCQYCENPLSLAATISAYSEGYDCLKLTTKHIQHNHNLLENIIKQTLPWVHIVEPDFSYFAWLDFSRHVKDSRSIGYDLAEKAGLALWPGSDFGKMGEGFFRMNLACPQSMLEEGLNRLSTYFNHYVEQ